MHPTFVTSDKVTVNWCMIVWCTQKLHWGDSSFTEHQPCNNSTVASQWIPKTHCVHYSHSLRAAFDQGTVGLPGCKILTILTLLPLWSTWGSSQDEALNRCWYKINKNCTSEDHVQHTNYILNAMDVRRERIPLEENSKVKQRQFANSFNFNMGDAKYPWMWLQKKNKAAPKECTQQEGQRHRQRTIQRWSCYRQLTVSNLSWLRPVAKEHEINWNLTKGTKQQQQQNFKTINPVSYLSPQL